MKRILISVITFILIAVSLTSCADVNSYVEALEEHGDYEIQRSTDPEEMREIASLVGLDVDDYEVKEAAIAYSGNSGVPIAVAIIECGSTSLAKELEEDAYEVIDFLETWIDSRLYPMEVVREGNVVLVGNDRAIGDAIGN